MIERLIDIAADEMKIDPAELRLRNTIPPEAMPYKTPLATGIVRLKCKETAAAGSAVVVSALGGLANGRSCHRA